MPPPVAWGLPGFTSKVLVPVTLMRELFACRSLPTDVRVKRPMASLLALLAVPAVLAAQATSAEIQSGQELLYSGQFGAAQIYFAGLAARYTRDPAGPVLEASALIWLAEARNDTDFQKDSIDLLLDDAERRAQAGVDAAAQDSARVPALLWLGMVKGYQARQANLHGGAWSAMRNARAMHSAYERAVSLDSTCADCLLGLGVYDYGLARVGVLARLGARILGLGSGNVERGLLRVKRAADAGVLLRTEARWVYANLLLREGEKDPAMHDQGAQLVNELVLQFPENPVFRRAQSAGSATQ